MPLSPADIDQLEALLFDDQFMDEALDYFALHGLVSASVVGPKNIPSATIRSIAFSGIEPRLEESQWQHFDYCINTIAQDLADCLYEGREPNLPYESEEEFEACLESWCIGFIEGFFENEAEWFSKDEEAAAELLLPVMTLSGLFDSEEFKQIHNNEKLMRQFSTIIADQLTDIYLFFHAK